MLLVLLSEFVRLRWFFLHVGWTVWAGRELFLSFLFAMRERFLAVSMPFSSFFSASFSASFVCFSATFVFLMQIQIVNTLDISFFDGICWQKAFSITILLPFAWSSTRFIDFLFLIFVYSRDFQECDPSESIFSRSCFAMLQTMIFFIHFSQNMGKRSISSWKKIAFATDVSLLFEKIDRY